MKIQFLGTAAFEGIPALFCDCENCNRSRELGGKNIRTRSQALIDDAVLIDFPADTYCHFINHNFPLHKIKTCLITHSHSDHLYCEDIIARKKGFSNIKNIEPMSFYAGKSAYEMIEGIIKSNGMSEDEIRNNLIEAFVPFYAEGYKITPLKANHDPHSSPVIYLIEKDGKCIFYATDSGKFPEETWEYLKSSRVKIDLVAFDCTYGGCASDYFGHRGMPDCIDAREKLLSFGNATKDTTFVLTHFSHNAKLVVYDDMKALAEKESFVLAYDGMVIEI